MWPLDLGAWLGNAPSRATPGPGPSSRVPSRAAEAALSLAGYRPAPANVWGRGAALDQILSARYCGGQRSGATHPKRGLVTRAAGLGIFHDGYFYMSPGGAQRRRGTHSGKGMYVLTIYRTLNREGGSLAINIVRFAAAVMFFKKTSLTFYSFVPGNNIREGEAPAAA